MPVVNRYIDIYNKRRRAEATKLAKKLISIHRLKPSGAFKFLILRDERSRYKIICREILASVISDIQDEEEHQDATQFIQVINNIKPESDFATLEEWCCVWHIFRRKHPNDNVIVSKIIDFLDL